MPLIAALALAAADPLPPPSPELIDFDLAKLPVAPETISTSALTGCAPAIDGDIVVCGSRQAGQRHRLGPTRIEAMPGLPRFELELADGVALGASVESKALGPPGVVSNRVMLNFKTRF